MGTILCGVLAGPWVGGSIGVKSAVVSWDHTLKITDQIIKAATRVRKDIFFLCHGGPIAMPEDAEYVLSTPRAWSASSGRRASNGCRRRWRSRRA